MTNAEHDVIDGELDDSAAPGSPGGRQRDQAVQAYREPAVPANPFDVDPAAFARQIQQRGENYAALVDWLVDNMAPGEDVVQVHVVSRDKCRAGGPPPRGSCTPSTTPGHWSDPDLSKRGAEKICGLLGLGTRFLGMDDFRRAALKGMKLEHVIVDCELYSSSGVAVSQGTGACSLSEVYDNLNSAMKKACKRAHVDAVKRCAGLSGLTTVIKQRMAADPGRAAAEAERAGAKARHDAGPAGRVDHWSTGAKLEVCPIGKHKGQRWSDIPAPYLEWLVKECADKPDLVRAAAVELKQRQESHRSAPAPGSTHARPSPPFPDEVPPEFDDEIPF